MAYNDAAVVNLFEVTINLFNNNNNKIISNVYLISVHIYDNAHWFSNKRTTAGSGCQKHLGVM